MKTWSMGFSEFLLRYKPVQSETRKVRKQLDTPVREKDENEFLSAHLELIETPVSRRPRLVAYFIMGLLVTAFILSVLGQVEIVAAANGKLTLNGRSKEIKPTENLIVKEATVKEGEPVRKGEVLLGFTVLEAEADTLKTQSPPLQARLEQIRYQILSRSIELNKLPELKLPDKPYFQNVSKEEVLRLTFLIKEQSFTWQNQKYQKELNPDKRRAERLTVLAHINRYENVPRVEKSRLDDFKSLLHKQAIAKHVVPEQENKYVEAVDELRAYKSQLGQIESEILPAKEEYQLAMQPFKSEILDRLRQTADSIELSILELEKNEERQQVSVIGAPVPEKIQQLKVHTEGGVVAIAETLMAVVPEDDMLEVTALVQNKDIGSINVGQNVTIEVEALPYTRYGYLVGKVKDMNLDVIGDQKLELAFSVIVSVEENDLSTGNKHIPLSLDMAVTAEIKTGVRSVISYLLSPLEEPVIESLHEC